MKKRTIKKYHLRKEIKLAIYNILIGAGFIFLMILIGIIENMNF